MSLNAQVLTGRVIRVVDADTYRIQAGPRQAEGRLWSLRLANADAPEVGQPFGMVARDSIARLIGGQLVQARLISTDPYSRYIADVAFPKSDGSLVRLDSLLLVRGWAWHDARFGFCPDCIRWEQIARTTRNGLWACREPCPPWLFRHFSKRQKQIWCNCNE